MAERVGLPPVKSVVDLLSGGVVATGEGAFRVRPIAFGLAFVVTQRRPVPLLVLAKVSRRFGGVFVNREIAERVDCVAFLARSDDEFL